MEAETEREELVGKLNGATSIGDLATIAKAMGDARPGHEEGEDLFMKQSRTILKRASVGDAIFLANAFQTWTGHHAVLKTFTEENGLKSMKDAAWVIGAVEDDRGGSLEAIKAIFEATRTFMADASLEELSTIANKVKDPSGNGRDSLIMEEAIVNAALPKIKAVDDVVCLARAFSVKTGRHRLVTTYAEKNGVSTEDEARRLFGLIRQGDNHGSKEAREAVLAAAKKAGIEIDLSKMDDDTCSCPACQLRRSLLGGLAGPEMGLLGLLAKLEGLRESMMGTAISTAEQLELALSGAQKSGNLHKIAFSSPSGKTMSVKEFLADEDCRKEMDPEMIPVLEKYAAMMA